MIITLGNILAVFGVRSERSVSELRHLASATPEKLKS